MDLFAKQHDTSHQPLAYRMRPRTLDEFIGQDHIVGKGRLLRRSIQADQLSSVIFYGPPGTGKTTLARVIANTTKSRFSSMNAVLSGVKDLRDEIALAKNHLDLYQRRTILFIDEVHRWNKSQQDALLPWVENGTVILIGATTENPFFEVNRALVSRSRIFQLTPLTETDLMTVAQMTLTDRERGYGRWKVIFEQGSLEHLVHVASGDARSLLNALELAVETTPDTFPPKDGSEIAVTMEAAEESIQRKVVLYDKEGDYHFDVISAFIKSIRGSDPDAALYWLARMVSAGEDPHYIFRRMLISACEDIGLADPHCLGIVVSAAAAFDRIGLPEGRFHLTHAALCLAAAPKSNSTMGFFDALKAVEEEAHQEVPVHLKDPSRDQKGFGHGEGYLYPHAYRDHWVVQQYLPEGLRSRVFYQPSASGYEDSIRLEVLRKREAQLEAGYADSVPEMLTFSPPDTGSERWLQRIISNRGELLSQVRRRIFSSLHLQRHYRVLDLSAGLGLLVWEACRLVPEGSVHALCADDEVKRVISRYAETLQDERRPILSISSLCAFASQPPHSFEAVIGRNALLREQDKAARLKDIYSLLAPGGECSCSETIPAEGTRLSEVAAFRRSSFTPGKAFASYQDLHDFLLLCEEEMYSDSGNPLVNWDIPFLEAAAENAGCTSVSTDRFSVTEKRTLAEGDVRRWIKRSYLPAYQRASESEPHESAAEACIRLLAGAETEWKTTEVHLCCRKA